MEVSHKNFTTVPETIIGKIDRVPFAVCEI
jgi:hypothetical protein